ncbi:unnamed protein product [Kuraishia capsulata CBS 1993]|uniref:tRNA pseudouridine(55) synthase n=1 Tax=Kuraishia capsulata CBS 1993 TaxID=1382522 RepID=W6MKD5_9ASCO|nr:uncharacterized protein KUCA_T00001089001 [Kuraishia capsulata CBS 1993]CDK25122.1 unnamed protein product [Kuraishia capsulata CBS 1993]
MEGVFAIEKPAGVSSAGFLNDVKRVFGSAQIFETTLEEQKKRRLGGSKNGRARRAGQLKMGHGGTLDINASGVLVVGIGAGTKKLHHYGLQTTKKYIAKALLGGATTSGDSDGELVTKTAVDGITKEMVFGLAEKFKGTLTQTPPLFSALKMEGKPLYEYAREGKPLPRAIASREVQIYDVKFYEDTLTTDHGYKFLKPTIDEDGVSLDKKLNGNPTLVDDPLHFSKEYTESLKKEGKEPEVLEIKKLADVDPTLDDEYRAPMIHFECTVSSGTYIRSLISDFGKALGSSAYMVDLVRSKQEAWEIGKNVFTLEDFRDNDEAVWGPVLQKVFAEGEKIDVLEELKASKKKFEDAAKTEKSTKEEGLSSKRTIDEV